MCVWVFEIHTVQYLVYLGGISWGGGRRDSHFALFNVGGVYGSRCVCVWYGWVFEKVTHSTIVYLGVCVCVGGVCWRDSHFNGMGVSGG